MVPPLPGTYSPGFDSSLSLAATSPDAKFSRIRLFPPGAAVARRLIRLRVLVFLFSFLFVFYVYHVGLDW